ncbi:restriction endonuclease subunit S [Limnohabitans sp.]|jgi:type I restriction enzyme S subunit|uniref:restriction endonuclease subunit S n=1 Tax=Limnohabitans sp. TaxID=1907725 RepID=UPI0037BFDF52
MDAQRFLAEFGHIANAPGGVNKLRELIRALAVQGKLVQQDANDESAATWLSHLKVTKSRLLQQKKITKYIVFADIPAHEYPYSLPPGWAFARLGAITNKIGSGSTPRGGREVYVREGVPFLRSQNVWNDGILLDGVAFITSNVHANMEGSAVEGNDILLNITGASLGRCALFPADFGDANVSQHVTIIRPTDSAIGAYLHMCMLSPYIQAMIWARQVGMAREGLSKKVLEQFEVPLPPVNEQSRIVAKVDELMALCDRLEAQQQQRRSLQNKLRQSTLQAVAAATSPHELQTTWARLADNFDQLFESSEDVTGFKGLILDLAMSGQLLNIEERSTSSATELLETISAARVAWSKECEGQEQKEALNMLKKLRTQQVASIDGVLPDHWVWATLLQVSQAVVDCHNKTAPYVGTGIHLIRTTDIRNGKMELANTRKISEETYAYWSRRLPPRAGDIFFTREAPMGEAAIVPEGQQVCLGQRSMLIRLFPDLFSNRFLLFVIQSPSFQSRMVEAAIGMTVKHLRVGGVEQLLVPVPPKSEQDRIVAIVDQLFQMCDHLADQLSKKKTVAAHLAQSAVAVITGIDIDSEEEEPLKAPQTELIAPLRLGQAPDIKTQAPLATILAHHSGELAAKDLWQRFGGDIEVFYAQLKKEVEQGWIQQPTVAVMREKAVG